MRGKKIKYLLYVITLILSLSFTLYNNPIIVEAGLAEGGGGSADENYGSIINKDSDEYKKIYGITGDEESKLIGQEDADASKPGWIQSALSTVFGLIGEAGKFILSLLGISIDGIVLGRMSANGTEVSKYFMFDMVDGNYPITYAAQAYGMLRSNIFFFLLVGFLLILLRYSFSSATAQIINDLKSKLSWIIISLFLLLALPNLIEIFLLLRDSISYGVLNEFTGGDLGNLNIVMWSYELWDDNRTIANCIVYIVSVFITGWFAAVYFVLAWMTAFLFSIVPVVLIYGIYDKSVWKNWLSLTLGNILCVFIDRILLCIPGKFPMPDGLWLDLNSLMRIASCGIIIPLRTAILNLLKFNMSYSGFGTALALMEAAKRVGKDIGKTVGKVAGGIGNAKKNYDDFKNDKKRAKEELELAKAEGEGEHGLVDSFKLSDRKTGLERLKSFGDNFSSKLPGTDRQGNSGRKNEDLSNLSSLPNEISNNNVKSSALDMNHMDKAETLSKEINNENSADINNSLSKQSSLENLNSGIDNVGGINKNNISPLNEAEKEEYSTSKNDIGLNDIKNSSFSDNKRLNNMIKKEKTSERIGKLANDSKLLQEQNKGLSNERKTVMEDIAMSDRNYTRTKNELQDKLRSVDTQLNNPGLSKSKKNELMNEKNNIATQLESKKGNYENEQVVLQGRLGQINKSMAHNAQKIQNNMQASQALETDLNAYNQKEQIYANMSGAVKASNSSQLQNGMRKQEILNKYVNSDNFESSRYQGALSHQQKAQLYLERAKRKKHNLIVQGAKDTGNLVASTVGAVSGAVIGGAVGLSVGGNAMTAVAGASVLSSAGNAVGSAIGEGAGFIAGNISSAVIGSTTNSSGYSGGGGHNSGNVSNNGRGTNNDKYQYTNKESEDMSTQKLSHSEAEMQQLKSKIQRETSIMQEELDKELQKKRRIDNYRDAEIKNLINDIVTTTKGNHNE